MVRTRLPLCACCLALLIPMKACAAYSGMTDGMMTGFGGANKISLNQRFKARFAKAG